jgi:hypothetical protein
MKLKRILALALSILLLITLFAGCAAKAPSRGDVAAPGDHLNSGSAKPEGSLSSGTTLNPGVADDRKLIRTVSMTTETEDMDTLLTGISQRITELGGYVESREVYTGSAYETYSSRSATMTLRIPAKNLDTFISHVDGASNVVSSSETAEDVTMQYVATESHLKVLQAEEERLLKFLSEAKSVSEMLEIEKRLTDVRAELESVTNQLNKYANLVSYGTVKLRINEVKQYTVVEKEEPNLWQRIGTGFVNSVKNVGVILEGLLVFFISALPYLAIPGVIVVIILLAVRKSDKKKKSAPPSV